MARAKQKPKPAVKSRRAKRAPKDIGPWRRLRRWALTAVFGAVAFLLVLTVLFAFLNPPITATMVNEWRRSGDYRYDWVAIEEVSEYLPRSLVAAEDANFCLHWGFDIGAIRLAIEAGGQRGASTISQQTVKNVYLWQGRNWPRKLLEAVMTPIVEAVWSKRRIVEVYLNVAEFGDGVFGAEAAAQKYFGVSAKNLNHEQAALLAAVLPNPKERSVVNPTETIKKRAAAISNGAATIRIDGRSACFES